MYAGGFNRSYQLGIESTTVNKGGLGCVDAVTPVPFDHAGIQYISGGYDHSVIIKDFSVFAAGDNIDFKIGSDSRQV